MVNFFYLKSNLKWIVLDTHHGAAETMLIIMDWRPAVNSFDFRIVPSNQRRLLKILLLDLMWWPQVSLLSSITSEDIWIGTLWKMRGGSIDFLAWKRYILINFNFIFESEDKKWYLQGHFLDLQVRLHMWPKWCFKFWGCLPYN